MDSLSVGARDDFASKNEEERERITLIGSRGSLTANPHIFVVQSPYSPYITIAIHCRPHTLLALLILEKAARFNIPYIVLRGHTYHPHTLALLI